MKLRDTLKKLWTTVLGVSLLGGMALSGAGCESKAATGALIGGGAGAGLGAIIGHNSHNRTVGGALIGGAVGAIAGGLIGNEMDKQDRRYPPPPPPGYYERAYRYDRPPDREVYEYREVRRYPAD